MTFISPLFVIGVNVVMLYILYGPAHLHWAPNIYLYIAIAILVHKIVVDAARRRADNIRRMAIVAECNHHIRNSLQSMVNRGYVSGYEDIRAAVERIEVTLREILPGVE